MKKVSSFIRRSSVKMLNEPEKTSHIIFFFSLNVNRSRQIFFSLLKFPTTFRYFRDKKKIVSQLVKSMSRRTILLKHKYGRLKRRVRRTLNRKRVEKESFKFYLHDVSSVSVLVERISVHRMLKSCVRTWKGKNSVRLNFPHVRRRMYPWARRSANPDRYFRNWEIMLYSDLLL